MVLGKTPSNKLSAKTFHFNFLHSNVYANLESMLYPFIMDFSFDLTKSKEYNGFSAYQRKIITTFKQSFYKKQSIEFSPYDVLNEMLFDRLRKLWYSGI